MATAACPVVYRIHALDISSGSIVQKADIQIPMKNPAVPNCWMVGLFLPGLVEGWLPLTHKQAFLAARSPNGWSHRLPCSSSFSLY